MNQPAIAEANAIRPRAKGAFFDIYPGIPVTSYDGNVWFELSELKPHLEHAQTVHQMVLERISGDVYGTPRAGNRSVLAPYNDIAQASLLGEWRGTALYLAVQAKLLERFSGKDDELKAAVLEKFGRPISRTLMSPKQAMALLDIPPAPKGSTFEQQQAYLYQALGFDEQALHEFEHVAKHYAEARRPNWMVIRTYLADYEAQLTAPQPIPERSLEDKLQSGLQHLSVRYGNELIKLATEIKDVNKQAVDTNLAQATAELFGKHPTAFYPGIVSANGFELSLITGTNLYPLFEWAQGNRDVAVQTAPFMGARGVAMPASQTLFVGTGPINADGTLKDPALFRRVLMEEAFHCADMATQIPIKGGAVNPSQLINRSRIHEWIERVPTKAAQVDQWVGKLSDTQLKALSNALDGHLSNEGRAMEELERGWKYSEPNPGHELSLREKVVKKILWDAEAIMKLHSGYAYTGYGAAQARNAETLVRFHRQRHMGVIFPEVEAAGVDYRQAMDITMPELSAIYRVVIEPGMNAQEKKAQKAAGKRGILAPLKDAFDNLGQRFSIARHGGLAHLAGYESMDAMQSAIAQQSAQDQAELLAAAASPAAPAAPAKGKGKTGIEPKHELSDAPAAESSIAEGAGGFAEKVAGGKGADGKKKPGHDVPSPAAGNYTGAVTTAKEATQQTGVAVTGAR